MRRDDCWLTKDRDASGNLQVDKRAFPDGLEPVIAHVHSKGLCATPFLLLPPWPLPSSVRKFTRSRSSD